MPNAVRSNGALAFSRIAGTGSYLPERVVTNDELEQMVDTSDEWIRSRTGIGKRHIVASGETTCDMAEHAARRALDAAGVHPSDLDLIVVGTATPDQVFPNVGCLLQDRLGTYGFPAFSVEAACAGFVYALGVADKFVASGAARCALVVGADAMSNIIDWSDRTTCVLFGDGAGAVVLTASEDTGVLSTHLHADGKHHGLLQVPSGISKGLDKRGEGADFSLRMKGTEVFRVAVNKLGDAVLEALAANELHKSDVDWLVPHQANIRIIQAIARKLDMPMERVVTTVEDHGNTSSASVPLALDAAVRDGRIQRDQVLLLEAFGGGFTWGSALVRF
ncbi:MAG: beta-ketoacyl-ACP synthase III [Pseudomonadota bacterium]